LLLKYGTDYQEVRHDKAEKRIADFFGTLTVTLKVFPNDQVFDFDGLRGRVLSSSYTPDPEHRTFTHDLRTRGKSSTNISGMVGGFRL
jgi:hypothetical protein